jgi:chloride channel protein, CIC family
MAGVVNLRLIRITAASVVAGAATGLVGAAFRTCLRLAEHLRVSVLLTAHTYPYGGWLMPALAVAIATGLARYLVVRFAPVAAGSGIQYVEAYLRGKVPAGSRRVVPVKFFGGILALGSGLALGREGPTVQMGATIGIVTAKALVKEEGDRRVVTAACAGAGLAVAFNAPVGGSVFVFEELTGSFTHELLVATLAAVTVAVAIMRLLLGNGFDFLLQPGGAFSHWNVAFSLVLGVLLGTLGGLYNATILANLNLSDRFSAIPSVGRSALIGAAVGLLAWFAPNLVGSGDLATQAVFSDYVALGGLAALFLGRFLIGPWSYAALTPGGLFSPILLVGASFGAFFAAAVNHFLPALGLSPVSFAVVGMVALFSASVRAPLTGIVLAVEMTGRGDLILGMLAAALGSTLVAMLLKSEPIYESLEERSLSSAVAERATPTPNLPS